MLNQKFNLVLVLGVSLLLTAGCTRKSDEDISKIQLVMPKSMSAQKIGSQAIVEKLAHVVINIRGDGMSEPIIFQWDGHDGNTVPDSFVLDVPKGNNRLVQILAVYKETEETASSDDGGKMNFYYGDVVKSLTLSQEGVVIPIASVGTGTIVSARISGRYLTSTDAGPTGTINIKYYPPSGRPGLIIEQAGIFNGWFAVFALAGADFTYELKDGTKLWDAAINANSSVFTPSSKVIKVALPVSLRNESWSGTANWKSQEPNYYIYGWFGPGAGTRVMCSGTVSNLIKMARYASPVPGSPALLSSSASTIPDVAALADTVTTLPNYYVNGGAACAGTEFVDKLTFNSSFIDGGGNDNSGVVMGALKPQFSGSSRNAFSQSVASNATGYTHSFSGEFLPGLYPSIFNQVHIFKRMLNDTWKYESGAPPCSAIAGGAYGFQKVSEVALSASTFSFNVDVPTGTGGNTSVAVCYGLNGQLSAGAGHMLNYYYFQNTGSGGGSSATQLATVFLGNKVASSTCSPFFVEPRDASNNLSYLNGSINLTFATDNVDTKVYSDFNCATEITSSVSFNGSSQPFFILRDFAGAVTRNLTITSSLPTLSTALNFVDPAGTAYLFAKAPSSINAYGCNSISYFLMLQNGADTMVGATSTYSNVSLPSVAGLTYYYSNSGPPCSATAGTTASLNGVIATMDFVYSGGASTLNLDATAVSGTPSISTFSGASAISVTQPGASAGVRISMQDQVPAEVCVPFKVDSVDGNGMLSPAPAGGISMTFTFNGSGSAPANNGVYSDPSCVNPLVGSASIAPSTVSSPEYYFRWTTPSVSVNFAPVVSTPAGFNSSTYVLTIGAVGVGALVPIPDMGVTFTWPTTFSGWAPMIMENESFSLRIEARSPMGNLLTNFSDTSATSMNLTTQYNDLLNCGAVSWTAGVGMANCTAPNPGNNYAAMYLELRSGGGSSQYPMYMPPNTGTPSDGSHIRIMKQPQFVGGQTDYLGSQNFAYSLNHCQPLLFTKGFQDYNYALSQSILVFGSRVDSGYTAGFGGTGITGWYFDSTCTTPVGSPTVASGESARIVYALLDGTTVSGINASTYNVSTFPTLTAPTYAAASPGAFSQYKITTSRGHYYKGCSPIMIVRADANGTAVPAAGAEAVDLTSNFAASFYSDATCTSNISAQVTFGSGDSAKLLFMRANVQTYTGGNFTVQKNASTETGSVTGLEIWP